MYKVVAQSVLIFGSMSWVVTGEMLKVLTEFYHRVARRIMGIMEKCGAGREWDNPAIEEAMNSAGIHHIRVYVKRRQRNISERVACKTVYALCTEAEKMLGMIWMVRWWDQDAVNKMEE